MSRGVSRPIRTTSRIRLRPARRSRWERWKNRLRTINWTMWVSVVTATVAVGTLVGTAVSIVQTADNAASDRRLQQRGQASDRYLQAVEQLASPGLDQRLGGIYALKQLYNDSPIDATQIVPVLLTYARGRAPLKNCANDFNVDTDNPPVDVEAAIRVVGSRPYGSNGSRSLDLSEMCLRNMKLDYLSLTDADFTESDAQGASFGGTDLSRSLIQKSNWHLANLAGARLDTATIINSDFSNTFMNSITAQRAFFGGVNFFSSVFSRSNLSGSRISGCDIRFADFSALQVSPQTFIYNGDKPLKAPGSK